MSHRKNVCQKSVRRKNVRWKNVPVPDNCATTNAQRYIVCSTIGRGFESSHNHSTSTDISPSKNWLKDWRMVRLGSGCDIVGRVVASETRDPRFESSQGQFLFNVNCCENIKIKKKDAENGYN